MQSEIGRWSRLVSIETAGGVSLDGLLTEPPNARAATVLIHGKGGNFYTGPGRFIPERSRLTDVCHLSINMRCHDLGYTRPEVPISLHGPTPGGADRPLDVAGGMWELVSDGHEDLRAAVTYLRDRGHDKVFLIGHSSGAFYATDYGSRDPDLAGRLLLSPLISNKAPLRSWFPGEGDLTGAVETARVMTASGNGHRLITLPTWYYGISAASFLERLDEADDMWMKAISSSKGPLLMIWGGAESRHAQWAELWDQLAVPDKEHHVIDGAEHFYLGFEDQVSEIIDQFLDHH
ncbi:MAG: alpha/beta hydrolase [Acidimicrobiia bacterium]